MKPYLSLAGALHKNAFPVFHPQSAELCRERTSYCLERSTRHYDEERDIWHEIIDAWGITYATLDRIPLSAIVDIRRDSLGIRVRETWHSIMNQAQQSQLKGDAILIFDRARRNLVELFEREIKTQEKQHARFRAIRGILEVGSWITSGLASLAFYLGTNDPFFTVIAAPLGFLAGKPILDVAQKALPRSELVILATDIRQRSIGQKR